MDEPKAIPHLIVMAVFIPDTVCTLELAVGLRVVIFIFVQSMAPTETSTFDLPYQSLNDICAPEAAAINPLTSASLIETSVPEVPPTSTWISFRDIWPDVCSGIYLFRNPRKGWHIDGVCLHINLLLYARVHFSGITFRHIGLYPIDDIGFSQIGKRDKG